MNVLGLDIGGANTKAAFLNAENGVITRLSVATAYFPFWKRKSDQLCDVLSALKAEVMGDAQVDYVGLTMTAELSDVYRTKSEGVHHIFSCVRRAFGDAQMLVVTADVEAVPINAAEPLKVAAANWAASGWLLSQQVPNCVIVDVGSTSASIIPIVEGRVSAAGKTDLEKLMNGELVYTGGLRTNVAAIVSSIPLRNGVARVSSELFAQSGDVHLVLGDIVEEQYAAETADGRGKSRAEALARLARVVCADTDMLSEKEILSMADYVRRRQVEQIAEALNSVYSRFGSNAKAVVPAVVAGLSKIFLAKEAAVKAGIKTIVDVDELLPKDAGKALPAVGAAVMAATKLDGGDLKWTL